MDIHKLKSLFESILFAVDENTTRYCLDAVRLETVDGTTTAIATDAKHLVTAQLRTDLPAGEHNVLAKSARTFCRRVTKRTGKASAIAIKDGLLINWTTHQGQHRDCKLESLEGRFPDYTRIINGHKSIAELTGNLADIKKWLAPQNGLHLSLNGGLEVGMPMRKTQNLEFSGEPVEIKFDPNKLASWLETLPDKSRPVIQFTGNDTQLMGLYGTTRYLLMPLT